ncbi:MAG: YidB family protein [Devosia sp.]
MAKGMPSMLALLGLLAVAGYQNRDKISGAIDDLKSRSPHNPDGSPDVLGGIANTVGGLFGGGSTPADGSRPTSDGFGDLLSGLGAGGLAGGLSALLGSFRNAGQAETADSWITPGVPTQGLRPDQVEQAIGNENLAELAQRTGLSREELIERLAKTIPVAVDNLTPNGELPTDEQVRQRLLPAA